MAGHETIMEDDMQVGSAPLVPEDLKKLSELSAYKIGRRKAEIWAHRDIKFLVYDDTNVQQNGYDSDDEEGMANSAMMISGGSATKDGNPKRRRRLKSIVKLIQAGLSYLRILDNKKATDDGGSIDEEGTINDESKDCSFCSSIPEFPTGWKPRKLRLVQPRLVSSPDDQPPGGPRVCAHYVAVSYCWPTPQKDEHGKTIETPGTYQVRDLDGTVRTSRALDNVLDRSVEFAASRGIRMIWIDQECLPQPREDSSQEHRTEQELGIQAMDIVYNRAVITAGLLSAEITIQEQIDSIRILRSFRVVHYDFRQGIIWEGAEPEPSIPDIARVLDHALDFLQIVSADRWYTRAWVAQEALSAGETLVLVLRLGDGISCESRSTSKRAKGLPLVGEPPARHQPRVFAISVKHFQRLVRTAKLLLQIDSTRIGDTIVRFDILGSGSGSLQRPKFILNAAEALHPIAPQSKALSERIFIPGGSNYRPRQTVDAAGALTLLGTRGCRDIQDRIAIVANMCDFENRLNTSIVARRCKSLRLALIALTILNGDYSLLVPEAYALDTEQENLLESQSNMGWLWPLSRAPHSLNYCRLHNSGFISSSLCNSGKALTPDGLYLSAYLWTVEDTVDFTPIQLEWAEKWINLKFFTFMMTKRKGQTIEELQKLQREVLENSFGDSFHRQQILYMTPLQNHFAQAGNDDSHAIFEAQVHALQMNIEIETRSLFAEIVFAILRYLYLNVSSELRAIDLANSIWQSLRVDAVSAQADELPDEVGDWLFSDHDIIDNPSALLQLDGTRDGSFSQSWFIDRIMRDGFLWVGCYHPVSQGQGDHKSSRTSPRSFESSALKEGNGKAPAGKGPISPVLNPRRPTSKSDTILGRQMGRKITASMMVVTSLIGESNDDTSRPDDGLMLYNRRNLASFIQGFNSKDGTYTRDLVSAFDVDGPCLVAIPHNGDWEMLPRPGLRSMSVCWVVEPVTHAKELGREKSEWDGPGSSLPDSEWVKGKGLVGEVKVENDGRHDQGNVSSMLVIGSSGHPESSERHSALGNDDKVPPEERKKDHKPSYRVLKKVPGLWQVLDHPDQSYIFT